MADPKTEVLYCPLCDELNKLEKAIAPIQKQIAELEHKRDRVTLIQKMRDRLQQLQELAKDIEKPLGKQQIQEINDLPGRIQREELLLSQEGLFGLEDRWRLKREQQEVPPLLEKLGKLDRQHPRCAACHILAGAGHIERHLIEYQGKTFCADCLRVRKEKGGKKGEREVKWQRNISLRMRRLMRKRGT